MHTALAGLILLAAAQSAAAGAWLREHRHGFSSASTTIRSFSDRLGQESSVYLEYGFRPKLTLGLDLNQTDSLTGHAMVFGRFALRKPWGRRAGQSRLALEAATGIHYQGQLIAPMHRLTLSWGHNPNTWLGPGWLALDLAIEKRSKAAAPSLKLDATLGLTGARRVQPMLQIQTSRPSGGSLNWAVIPSIRIKRKKGVTWVLGLERKYAGQHSVGLMLSVWKNFEARKAPPPGPRKRRPHTCRIICPFGQPR